MHTFCVKSPDLHNSMPILISIKSCTHNVHLMVGSPEVVHQVLLSSKTSLGNIVSENGIAYKLDPFDNGGFNLPMDLGGNLYTNQVQILAIL